MYKILLLLPVFGAVHNCHLIGFLNVFLVGYAVSSMGQCQ